jgi:hypothetical protein
MVVIIRQREPVPLVGIVRKTQEVGSDIDQAGDTSHGFRVMLDYRNVSRKAWTAAAAAMTITVV